MLDSSRFGLGLSFGFTAHVPIGRRAPALPGSTLASASSLGVTAQRCSSRYASPMVRLDGHMSWPPDRGMAPPMRCHSPLRIAMEYLGVLRCYGTGWGSIEARPGTLRYNASRDCGVLAPCAVRRRSLRSLRYSLVKVRNGDTRRVRYPRFDSASDRPPVSPGRRLGRYQALVHDAVERAALGAVSPALRQLRGPEALASPLAVRGVHP